MKKVVSIVACATVVLMAASVVMAGEGKAKGEHKKGGFFTKADTDKDGKLSLEEFKAVGKDPVKAEAKFQKADANKDGFVTPEELKAGAPHGKKAKKEGCDKPADVPAAPAEVPAVK